MATTNEKHRIDIKKLIDINRRLDKFAEGLDLRIRRAKPPTPPGYETPDWSGERR